MGEEEDPSKPKKKITDVFTERAEKKKPEAQKVTIRPKDLSKMQSKFVKVDLPVDEGPVRRKKKPVEEEVPVTIEPVVEVQTAPPVVQEEILEAPEEIVEVESAPLPPKDKVSEEFQEKEKKPKEEEKIVITPAKLPTKKGEEEESSEEESSEEEDPDWDKKPKKGKVTDVFTERQKKKKPEGEKVKIKAADLSKMKAAFVKVELPPDEGPVRRKKKQPVEEEVPVTIEPVVEVQTAPPVVQEEILEAPEEIVEVEAAPPPPKAKISEEFTEKDKKPEEEESESEEEEEEEVPAKKKLSKADLKPAVQIKVAIEEDKPALRRKKREPSVEEADALFAKPDKSKVNDEYAKREEAALAEGKRQEELEAERRKKEEEEKAKKAEEAALEEEEEERLEREKRAKIDDEFAEKMKKIEEESKIVITPAILKAKEEAPEEESEEEEEDPSKPKKKITDVFTERAEKKKPEAQKVTIRPKDLSKMQSKFVKV